jgi:hypothetical protein
MAQVEEALRAAGLELADVRRIEPGLEDVFVSVLSGGHEDKSYEQS